MILKGSQRGGARQLAVHLLRTDENDHVELHELKGFMADDLGGALREAYAISKGTRCEQFLFSLSLSPPQTENVPVAAFEQAIDGIEAKLGLTGQPRVIIFHEKQGRRHAHCVWSRVDADAMKAINLPHFKLKLRDVSRKLFIEHGWHMPAGLTNSAERDPRNFTREEWQQAKRAEKDPGALKELFQDCWAISDSRKAFAQALEARGFYLARGDRRGFVAIDVKGEVYSVPKWTGLKTKAVEARLGDPGDLRSVDETKAYIAALIGGMLGRHLDEADADLRDRIQPLIGRKAALRRRHRQQRAELESGQTDRAFREARHRAQRYRVGLKGLWDRLTGRHARTRRENEADALLSTQRDADERQALIQAQLQERRALQTQIIQVRRMHNDEVTRIHRDVAAQTQSEGLARKDHGNEKPPAPRSVLRKRQGPSL